MQGTGEGVIGVGDIQVSGHRTLRILFVGIAQLDYGIADGDFGVHDRAVGPWDTNTLRTFEGTTRNSMSREAPSTRKYGAMLGKLGRRNGITLVGTDGTAACFIEILL